VPHKPYIILWPEREEVQGIYVAGHCIRLGSRRSDIGNAHAHAHDTPSDPNFGWICCRPSAVPELGTLADTDTTLPYIVTPGLLAVHELAHIVNRGRDSHGWLWRNRMSELELHYLGTDTEAVRYTRAGKVQAQGHFLIGQRVKVAAHAKPVALRGQVAIVRKVGTTRLSVAFEHPEQLGKFAKYTYWPASLVEHADTY
jgi:hypothetical protein